MSRAYSGQIADCNEGFRTSARMIWKNRAADRFHPLGYRYLRNAMHAYAVTGRAFRVLAEGAALEAARVADLSAAAEGADAYSVTFDGTVA
jgi:hypothetical protein